MLTLGVGRSSTYAWFQRKATFPSCPLGDRSPWFLHCTKCMKCACGRSWTKNPDLFPVSWWGEKLFVVTKNSDHFPVSWWRSGLACNLLISSLSWWKVCAKLTSVERSCSLSPCVRQGQRPGVGRRASGKRCHYHLCGGSGERKFGASGPSVFWGSQRVLRSVWTWG